MGEEAEVEEREISPHCVIQWDPIHRRRNYTFPPPIVAIREISDQLQLQTSLIFPPSNHENLRIVTSPPPSDAETRTIAEASTHPSSDDHETRNFIEPSSPQLPQPPCNLDAEECQAQASPQGDVSRWFVLGLEVLRSHVNNIVSSVRDFAKNQTTRDSFPAVATAATAAMMVAFFYVRRRRRLRERRENVDDLIRVIIQKDEVINELLHQIAQMNEVLLRLNGAGKSKAA